MKLNMNLSACTVAALLILPAAVAQTAPPPEPGAAATPGQSNPDRSDPTTSTPSTINRAPERALSQEGSRQSQSSDSDMSSAGAQRPKVGREARQGGLSAGTVVQNPAGENIGRVKDIVPDANTGEPAYVVITSRSGSTAVPYAVIAPMYHDTHVLLDRSRLESAPQVSDEQLRDDRRNAPWKQQVARYWESRHPPSLE